MITDIKAKVDQIAPDVLSEGRMESPRMTMLGQLFTADWKTRLVLAGKMYRAHIGAIAAGSDVTYVTGGGAGTTPEVEKPEIYLGVDAGYFLIPIECDATIWSDTDAPDVDYISAMLLMDRTKAPEIAPTAATVLTPVNCLDGGPAFPGRAFEKVTTDVSIPVLDDLLMYRRISITAVVMNGTAVNEDDAIISNMDFHWEADYPNLAAGPCSMVFWFAGAVACSGLATVTFACVPTSWFPTK